MCLSNEAGKPVTMVMHVPVTMVMASNSQDMPQYDVASTFVLKRDLDCSVLMITLTL